MRVAVSGCGAVSKLFYAPALRNLQARGAVGRVYAFDPDSTALGHFCDLVPNSASVSSFSAAVDAADFLIVASPPRFHAEQCVSALDHGIGVLCEKPLALSEHEGTLISDAAERTGRSFSFGLIRRYFPATNLIKDLVQNGSLGTLHKVVCFEGGPFEWPVQSHSYFNKLYSGGGVLQDIGTHSVDLMLWWFGEPASVEYEDDALGGVEADCLLRLVYPSFVAEIRLSRTWARPNYYLIEGSRGWIKWTCNEANWIETGTANSPYVNKLQMHTQDRLRQWPEAGAPALDFFGSFEAQIEAALAATRGKTSPSVSAGEGLAVLRLIEQCYQSRKTMHMPWLWNDGAAKSFLKASTTEW